MSLVTNVKTVFVDLIQIQYLIFLILYAYFSYHNYKENCHEFLLPSLNRHLRALPVHPGLPHKYYPLPWVLGWPCPIASTWPQLKGKDSQVSVPVSDTRKSCVSGGMTEWDSAGRSTKEERAACPGGGK